MAETWTQNFITSYKVDPTVSKYMGVTPSPPPPEFLFDDLMSVMQWKSSFMQKFYSRGLLISSLMNSNWHSSASAMSMSMSMCVQCKWATDENALFVILVDQLPFSNPSCSL